MKPTMATNPNFAAVVVEMLKEAGLEKNDIVAVAFTGSLPGLNIAVHSALQTLKLKPIIITSVGASNWGANDPYYTWLDMESALFKGGIFENKSIAASIGGGLDRGRGLSPEGRQLIVDAIERVGIEFINEEHLEGSIQKRIEIYNKHRKKNNIKAFINVGGRHSESWFYRECAVYSNWFINFSSDDELSTERGFNSNG